MWSADRPLVGADRQDVLPSPGRTICSLSHNPGQRVVARYRVAVNSSGPVRALSCLINAHQPESRVNYSTRIANQVRGQSPMAGLDRRNLGPMQVFAQSVSGAAPAAAMAVVPAIVAASAGAATIWSVLIATGLALLVAGCIGRFTRRMAAAGSLYSLTAKGLGAGPALLAGAGLLVGYSLLGMASLTGAAMQITALIGGFGVTPAASPVVAAALVVVLAGLVAACTVRGVRLSAAVVLLVEALSITLMLVVFGVLLVSQGIGVDSRQLVPSGTGLGAVVAGVLPALGAFIGFEAAAAMGVEARRPFR